MCVWVAVFHGISIGFCKFEKFACYYNPIVWICILKNKVTYLMYCITLTTNPAQCKGFSLFWHLKEHFKTKIYLIQLFSAALMMNKNLYFCQWKKRPQKYDALEIFSSQEHILTGQLPYTVFPHIVSAETILFWIWKSNVTVHKAKGHST